MTLLFYCIREKLQWQLASFLLQKEPSHQKHGTKILLVITDVLQTPVRHHVLPYNHWSDSKCDSCLQATTFQKEICRSFFIIKALRDV